MLNAIREYFYPDGRLACRERVVYSGNDLVSFELEDLQTGSYGHAEVRRGGASSEKGSIRFDYTEHASSKNKPETDAEPLQQDVMVNDMVGPS
jgi:hypothetical protein